jgi:hypothetical protein
MGGAGHNDRRHHRCPRHRRAHHRADAWEAWAFLGPSGGDDAGRRDHGRPHHDARRHLAGSDHPGPPDGARAEPVGAATGAWGPSLPRPPALHHLHLGRTGPIGPERRQYDLLNPRRGIMMRLMQSMVPTQEPPRSSFSCPRWAWRRPSGPTAPRSGNMSFSHCPARHPRRRMKCNSGRSQFLPSQSSNVYVYKFSQSGCRFISKSIGQKIKLIARPISIFHVFR